MRVFIVTNDFWNLVNFRKPLLKELTKKNFELIILTNLKKKNNLQKIKNIKLHHINFKSNFNFINDLINYFFIFLFCIKYKPNIILNFTIKPVLLCSFIGKLLNIKCINTITGFGNLYLKSNLFKKCFLISYKLFTSQKNYFFFHNKVDYKYFLNNRISQKSKSFITMGSGVNLSIFNNLKPKLKKKINFLMISRLIYNKGVIEFLEAVKLLRNNNNLYFKLLGRETDDNLNEIKKSELSKYSSLKNLKILNFSKNVKGEIKDTNFVILPSYREGMPKSLMESISSGIPVIASNVVGNSDLVLENVNGFLCRPQDNRSLYNVILKVSKIKKQKYNLLSKNCRKYAEYYLDENKVTHKYLTLIKKII
jgi:glycosyltransferase involved in cell wall biosynthesis